MCAIFKPYLDSGSSSMPTNSDAYIRVRVPNAPQPDGSTLVYLPNGTAFVVNSRHLLRISPDNSASPEQPTTGKAEHRDKDLVADDHR